MVKLRTQKISISIPRINSEPWVYLIVQRVELDENGKEINVVDRWGTVNKQLSAVATDVFTYFEPIPVPNPANMISAFAIADAIKVVAVHWIQEKYGGTINQDGDVVL